MRSGLGNMVAVALTAVVLLIAQAGFSEPAPKRYSGLGLVVSGDPSKRTLTISHENIPGYMDAMVMTFSVRDRSLFLNIHDGDRVYFRLVVETNASFIDHVTRLSAAPVDPRRWQTPVLSRLVSIGEIVPDFHLIDHNNEPVSLGQFRGKVVAINFIYTRCPLPDYCPRMTNSFVDIGKRFADRMERDLVLLTITIDPKHDTTDVLKAYSRAFGGGFPGWHLLSGSVSDVKTVSGYFGMEYWPDSGALTHNLQTPVIDRNGRLAANVEGRNYSARQLGDLIEARIR